MKPVLSDSSFGNGILYLMLSTGFALIGGMVSDYLFYFGLLMDAAIVMVWALSYEGNRFMDSPVKVLQYMKYDFRNGPIYYVIAAGCWIVTIINAILDHQRYNYIEFDIWLSLISIYFISCIMVLWGYTKEYDKLK
jgi:hypothetical protein